MDKVVKCLEQDLQVTDILGSKGKDHGGYSQKLESVDVLTPYPGGDYVGVEGPRDARDARVGVYNELAGGGKEYHQAKCAPLYTLWNCHTLDE